MRRPRFQLAVSRAGAAARAGAAGTRTSAALDNDDLRPLGAGARAWGFWTYLTFWFAAASSVADWYGCSAAVAAGLAPLEALFVLFGGRVAAALLIAANGRGGAAYGVGYPALARASFGVWGAFWPVLSRVVLSVVYQGINLVQGGTCLYVMLHALTPNIARLPNIMPKGSGIDTGTFIGIIVIWAIFFVVAPMNIPKAKITVYIRLVSFLVAAIAMLAWCCSLAGGAGAVLRQPGKAKGTEHKWLLVKFFFVGISSCATFITNASDFQRYAKKANDPIVGNLLGGPLSNLLVHLVGVVIASSSTLIFGKMQWNPVLILDQIMEQEYSAKNRVGAFFIALCFCYGIIITMVFENVLPAANDIAGLLPKYIDYRRAAWIVGLVSLAMNPWYLLGSAAVFVTYISSFGIFLASIIGVMMAHYYVITRGHIDIENLYRSSKTGPYYYTYGFNLRAYVAYLCGIIPTLDGFAGAVGRKIPVPAQRFYYFAFPIGLVISMGVYIGLCWYWPVSYQHPMTEKGWNEPKEYRGPEDLENAIIESLQTNDDSHSEADKKSGDFVATEKGPETDG
ncbi:NCS1 nucleoside transporter [Xylariomycetidae sp. FL0641]|nr:NCS1 nucleoside transporter [Xylariomycetidae sp. FL0641]